MQGNEREETVEEREWERDREWWVGIGRRTYKLPLSWQQWKKPLVIEKQRNQRRKNSCRAMGAEKQACLPHLFFFFSFFPPTVVSHSATEERCIVASRLVRPLSTRILEGIGGDTAQIGLYAAVWRILLSAESCFCRKEKQWRNMQNQNLYRSSTVYVRKEFESGFQ